MFYERENDIRAIFRINFLPLERGPRTAGELTIKIPIVGRLDTNNWYIYIFYSDLKDVKMNLSQGHNTLSVITNFYVQ